MVEDTIDVPIEHAVWIRAATGRVYEALTTGAELDRWFTDGATVDARPGGEICWRWKEWGPNKVTTEDCGPILEADPGRRFVFQWHADPTTVEIDLEEQGGGCVVRLRERGYRKTLRGLKSQMSCAVGWGEALTLLKFYVEHGVTY